MTKTLMEFLVKQQQFEFLCLLFHFEFRMKQDCCCVLMGIEERIVFRNFDKKQRLVRFDWFKVWASDRFLTATLFHANTCFE